MDPVEVEETVEETVETATTTQRTKIASVAIKKGGVVERKGRQIDSFGRERNVTAEPESNSVSADGGHQRNRRLFGALMGHLSQAKQNLAKDSTLIEKRLAVESKRVAKQEQLNTTLCQLEREMIEAQRLKQTSQLRLDTLQTKKSEMVGVIDTWRAQTAPLAHVLMTETEPKLCWLPSTHNKTTQNLLNLRTAHVQAMIQTRETEGNQPSSYLNLNLPNPTLTNPNLLLFYPIQRGNHACGDRYRNRFLRSGISCHRHQR